MPMWVKEICFATSFQSLQFQYKSVGRPDILLPNADWIGDKDEPLKGFSWRSGTKRDTTGIIMWSDAFLHDLESGEKVAILLMDTQGLFDNESTTATNSRIFSLSTLISSVQILNLFNIIQEDHLQYLQFATEYARFASTNSAVAKPFQNLMFLIRDWNNPDEYPFGSQGGENYLQQVLKVKDGQKDDLKSVREFVSSSFENICCFLMPYPGKAVARDSSYDGRWSKMDDEFLSELKLLIPTLLAPANLKIKKINDKNLSASEWNEYVQSYFELFKSNQLPAAQSIYESTIEKQMQALIYRCFEEYKSNVDLNFGSVTELTIPMVHDSWSFF